MQKLRTEVCVVPKSLLLVLNRKSKYPYKIKTCPLIFFDTESYLGFPGGISGKESACQCRRCKRCRFYPWVRKIPWSRKWQPSLVFLPGKSQGQRSLVVYSPWENNLTYLKPVNNFEKVNMNLGVILSILWTLSSYWPHSRPVVDRSLSKCIRASSPSVTSFAFHMERGIQDIVPLLPVGGVKNFFLERRYSVTWNHCMLTCLHYWVVKPLYFSRI